MHVSFSVTEPTNEKKHIYAGNNQLIMIIGSGTVIEQCSLDFTKQSEAVIIGDNCIIESSVKFILTDLWGNEDTESNLRTERVVIERNAFIGHNVTICSGSHVGQSAQILPGTTITGVVPPLMTADGTPMQIITQKDLKDRAYQAYEKNNLTDLWNNSSACIKQLESVNNDAQKYISILSRLFEYMQPKRILIVGSSYTTLLYTLLFHDWENVIVLGVFTEPKHITANMKKLGIPTMQAEWGHTLDLDVVQILAKFAREYNIPVYGNEDSIEAGYFIKHNFIGLEDGLSNYDYEAARTLHYVHMPNGDGYVPFGFNEWQKTVYLTGLRKIPSQVQDKARLISLHDLWNKKSSIEQKKIMDVFGVPIEEIKEMLNEGRDVLFISGSFSDNVGFLECSVGRELDMYHEALSGYDCKKIIIKPHPRSTIDYRRNFPGCAVLPAKFPIEFINLLDIKIRHVVTINSSGGSIFPDNMIETRIDLLYKYGVNKLENASEK